MKRTDMAWVRMRQAMSVVCAVSVFAFAMGLPAVAQQAPAPYPAPYPAPAPDAQQAPPPGAQPQAPASQQPLLTPEQLDNLVAPIALYPDPLLGQVLAASTYPLEVVEAQQWLQRNTNLHGADLMNAARQQNWDPSVQAIVAFPDVLAMLNRDVQWTTDLGNAFLAQQQDVMQAVQSMRVRAQQDGRLATNSQQTVTTQTQNGQSAVVIEPANPQVIYVPVYNPDYVWGAPVGGYYPPLWYPPVGFGFGFGPGIFLDAFFPGWLGFGWGGWGLGWGWGCGWFGGGLFMNAGFFNHWGYRGFYGGRFGGGFGGGFGGRYAWAHDSYHRAGVPYANGGVAARFNNSRFAAGRFDRGAAGGARSFAGSSAARGFNGGGAAGARGFAPSYRGGATAGAGAAGGWQHFGGAGSATARGFAPSNGGQSYRGNSGSGFGGASRSYAAPRSYSNGGGFSGNARSFSGGGYSGSARSFSGGGFSGGRSFGGGGGSRSFGGGGGGHSFGGGGSHGGGGGHGGGGHR